ncbi:NADPH:quinone reductase [Micromonospora echinospora]|uniref:NADPH2:quinone reductase n=1 Tax=Micromonospora echinospora TaxID=1877 RepID=A0A1C4ZQY9_MICEC|nr:zinc-binding dehydrogenase [Micromonospora echinospora]OZV81691.1 NADPH:quinone reductase [Micromonospora echinospora]SCF35181.1 NADPH2:quinone reductase [Micromonospora echinospora]
MRVVEVSRFGGPEVLTLIEVPDPAPGPGEVVVDVAVADVLWVETMIRSGHGGRYFPVQPPYRAGVGVAGTVAAVGPGADPAWAGRRVVARTGERGGYAERVAVPTDGLVPVPEPVGLREAAALLHDGTTAFGVLDLIPPRPGDRVLVTAAGGGLGALLVQCAHAAGARVVAAARGAAKLDRIRGLGADHVVDYSAPDWTDRVRTVTGGLDVVFDGAGGAYGRAAFDLLEPGGRYSAHGTPAGAFAVPDPQRAAARGVTVIGIDDIRFPPEVAREHLVRALDAAAAGRLTPLVGQTFPLARAADAHRAIEARTTTGKTLLTI